MAEQQKNSRTKLDTIMKQVHRKYGHHANLTAVDVGYRYMGGEKTDEICVRIHVTEKLPLGQLSQDEIFPRMVDGVPIDVINGPYRSGKQAAYGIDDLRLSFLMGGVSCGRHAPGAGTAGLIVINESTGRPAILSNWHVLAGATAKVGDPVLQPAAMDGGHPVNDRVARLSGWILNQRGDAALADIDWRRAWLPLQSDTLMSPRQARRSRLGEVLVKSGRSTGVTRARVDGEGIYRVSYEVRPGAFEQRDIAGFKLVSVKAGNPDKEEISAPGDSGAVWMSERSGDVVGLHFAGERNSDPASENALACHMPEVLDALGARIATFEDLISMGSPYGQSSQDTDMLDPFNDEPDDWHVKRDFTDWPYHPERTQMTLERPVKSVSVTEDIWPRLKSALLEAGDIVAGTNARTALSIVYPGIAENVVRLRIADVINTSPHFDDLGLANKLRSRDFKGSVTLLHICSDIHDSL